MDKDNNNDTSYFLIHLIIITPLVTTTLYTRISSSPNSRYFTIVIYGLLFVLGAILIFKLIGGFNNTLNIIKYIFNVISPFVIGAFIAIYIIPTCKIFLQTFVQGKMPFEVGQAFLNIFRYL